MDNVNRALLTSQVFSQSEGSEKCHLQSLAKSDMPKLLERCVQSTRMDVRKSTIVLFVLK
jgi:hypothetical protein